jgi:hypothetical protein
MFYAFEEKCPREIGRIQSRHKGATPIDPHIILHNATSNNPTNHAFYVTQQKHIPYNAAIPSTINYMTLQ